MTEFMVKIPDSLASEAGAAGLLAPDAIEAMLRESLRRRAIDDLFVASKQLSDVHFPPMTMEEIQAEVNAVRQARKQRAPGA